MARRTNPFSFGLGMMRMGIDAQQVIARRLAKIAKGGPAANREATKMMAEKVAAANQAGFMLMSGKSPQQILTMYRRKVAANRKRLK